MKKIATHDSATGEKPANILSWLMIPFARTQSKTISEQYKAGCRMFDLRVKQYKGALHCAHGLFITKKTFIDIISEINSFKDPCYVTITYEGKLSNEQEKNKFINDINEIQAKYNNIFWGAIAVKYTDNDTIVDWKVVYPAMCQWPKDEQAFLPLDGKHWQTYLPIPWLWKQFHFKNVVFDEEIYKFVDFL